MSSTLLQSRFEAFNGNQSMQEFGEIFIEALPQHIGKLKIPGRTLIDSHRREPVMAKVTHADQLQDMMLKVLNSPITQEAQSYAERAFDAFLNKQNVDSGV